MKTPFKSPTAPRPPRADGGEYKDSTNTENTDVSLKITHRFLSTVQKEEEDNQGCHGNDGHSGVSANMMKKKNSHKKQRTSVGPSKTMSPPRRNIVGCRIQHIWKEGIVPVEGDGPGQVPVNPSLYLIKYDGFDCIYGLELPARVSDSMLAETMIGKAVEHMFETEDGPKEEWRGMVLARAPIMTAWFYITYEKDPVLYMYQLLDDYKEGDLRIMPDSIRRRLPHLRLRPGQDLLRPEDPVQDRDPIKDLLRLA
ncbi:hypothetical protein F7725_013496 [Dissostichus mawsoni]|uniref:Spindlin n=1 Tax=Dissostichus mawsoni TaxID=36200 RepID=A0A7J5YQ80_DISMA|nr:hypothetical protein F7725_013496 [Dissostichus mawsoni]